MEGQMARVSRRGTADWGSETDRAEGRLCINRVSASDPRLIRIALPCGSRSALRHYFGVRFSEVGAVAGSTGGGYGADESDTANLQPQPVVDVPLARLWRLMADGNHVGRHRVEMKMRKPPGSSGAGNSVVAVLFVEVTQSPFPH